VKYRSRTEICEQILQASTGGATKTKIMYKAFLSYAQLKDYLTVMVENDLLNHDEGQGTYKCTAKGTRFMHLYEKLGNISGLAITPNENPNLPYERPTH